MKYQELVDVYSSLEATTKRLEKTDIIADYLKTLDSDTIEKVGLLILGTVFPAWSSEEIGIGGKLVERAVAEAVGTTPAAVEDAIRDEGDIGLACIKLYAKKSQMTFFSDFRIKVHQPQDCSSSGAALTGKRNRSQISYPYNHRRVKNRRWRRNSSRCDCTGL